MPAPDKDDMWLRYRGHNKPLNQATVSAADHGLLYGDSVYETLRTMRGEPFLVDRHLQRLRASAAGVRLELPWSDQELLQEIEALRADLPPGDHYLRLLITRGCGTFSYSAENAAPELLIYGGPFKATPEWQFTKGLRSTVVEVRRTGLAGVKSSNLLHLRLAYLEAESRGFDAAILLNSRGEVAEASSANLFLVFEGPEVVTPNLESGVLDGLTRRLILELATDLGIKTSEASLKPEELPRAKEAFLTSTTRSLCPLRCIDDHPLAVPGPVTERLMVEFKARFGAL